jgi:drug/metabolite transporter (DMT)-like permease
VLRLTFLAGALEMGGLLLLNLSIEIGPLSIAGVMASQLATFATLLGVVVLKERPRWWQLLGIGLTVGGVSLLAVVG